MRNTRAALGPPSTLSSSSGHGLVYGTHRPRGPQHAFTQESPVPAKRKTKLIVILGIALPVLACVIGIAAWAVTTDVLRITPRPNDNNYNRFGHQGKTRIDNMQSRSDQDVDVFVLHGITPPTSPSPNSSTKKTSTSTTSTTGSSVPTGQTMTSPKASDILSKLISDMPPPKNPKNFIVFAPIADTGNTESQRKGRRFDSKIVHRDGDDLVAEESVISEDTSQELGLGKVPFNRKRKPTFGDFPLKQEMGLRVQKKMMNQKDKLNRNPRILRTDHTSESPPNFIKRPNHGEYITFPTNTKPPLNIISNRNGGITVPRNNANFPKPNFPNPQQNNANGFQNYDKKNMASDKQSFRGPSPTLDNNQPRKPNLNYPPSGIQQPSQSSFNNKENSLPQFPFLSHSNLQKKEPNIQINPYLKDNQRPPPSFSNQQNVGSTQTQFATPHTSHSFPNQQNIGSTQNQFSPSQNSQQNFPNAPQNTFSPESSQSASGGPQYFAPPPQTYHTKINYDQPSSKFSQPSGMSSYEKVAQTSVDQSATDGTHHHHHHHHHHEPVASNSDPVGDVNYSDVPRVNDADRLGSIGIGMGPSRGITVQIGGGGGGLGGLGGLLPLSTLGIAKNIVSALLPRPQLGLNSKVFLGVEIGKGGGLNLGLG